MQIHCGGLWKRLDLKFCKRSSEELRIFSQHIQMVPLQVTNVEYTKASKTRTAYFNLFNTEQVSVGKDLQWSPSHEQYFDTTHARTFRRAQLLIHIYTFFIISTGESMCIQSINIQTCDFENVKSNTAAQMELHLVFKYSTSASSIQIK